MSNALKIYCIVVTYNGAKWIDRCFGSLVNSKVPVHILAIDNNSSDKTPNLIKQNFSTVEVIETGSNLGFGKANNMGLKKSLAQNADYIFLLNQDAWIKENTIEELVKAAKENPEYGIISPFHLDASETNFERLFVELFDRYNKTLIPDMFFNRVQAIYEVEYIHAASWFITRACAETTGGFDPLYFHYGEDDDYLQRAKYFKFKTGLVPSAFIIHDAAYNNAWEKLEYNQNRNAVFALQQLKKLSPSFRSNFLSFLKAGFDEMTTLLLFRKFKKFKFRLAILCNAIFRIKKIHASYQHSFTKGAFLND